MGAVVNNGGADEFGFVQAVDRSHEVAVVRVADGLDRWRDLLELEVFG